MNKVDPMNKPFVDNRYRREAVDLQPYGNTISVETASDNPFEANQDVEIFTQQSGGMSGPDPKMQSRRGHRKVQRRVTPGNVAARQFNAPATSARGFMPGLGEDPSTAASLINAAGGAFASRYDSQAAAARAREAAAQARAEEARTERSRVTAMFDQSMFNMGQHGGIVVPLLMVGGAALVVAMVLKSKRKGRR